jgi:uncharacterized protein (UPF0548 family)
MSLHVRRPSTARLEALLRRCTSQELTYAPAGISLDPGQPTALHRGRWETALPGDEAFERGRAALHEWAVHRGSGISVVPGGPLAVGTNVAMAAPLPLGFIDATCRIVHVIDEPDRFGFAYGTLPVHPETGEEAFIVSRAADGAVSFTVAAASKPVHPLARLVPPIAGRMQDAACRRYLAAMRAATA